MIMDKLTIKADAIYGSLELKTFYKFENGRMVTYSYSINRDMNGVETSRTEPTSLSSIGYDDGSEFTEGDYDDIIHDVEKRGF